MIRFLMLFIVYFWATILSQAQVPGFQGKRAFISYDAAINASFVLDIPLHVQHILKFQYIVSRRHILVGSIDYISSNAFTSNDYIPTTFTSYGVACQWNSLRRGHLPPTGTYFSLGTKYSNLQAKETGVNNEGTFSLSLAWGYRRILWSKVLIHAGLEGNIPFQNFNEKNYNYPYPYVMYSLGVGYFLF